MTRHECESILAASGRASHIGRPFNRFVTIRLAKLGIPPARIHAALEAWLKYWRDWMATNPSTEQMQEVFKELSARDKGAVKPIRDKRDELKKAKGQEGRRR